MTIKTDHRESMDLTGQAISARHAGRYDEALALYSRAADIEMACAGQLSVGRENEHTRAILYRSAATLCLWAMKTPQAKQMAYEGKRGVIDIDLWRELCDVITVAELLENIMRHEAFTTLEEYYQHCVNAIEDQEAKSEWRKRRLPKP